MSAIYAMIYSWFLSTSAILLFYTKANYHCIISGISKSKAINLMQNIDLTKKGRTLKNIKIDYHIKMGKEILTSDDIEIENK